MNSPFLPPGDPAQMLSCWQTLQALAETLDSPDSDSAIQTVRNALVQTAGYDRVSIYLLDPKHPGALLEARGAADDEPPELQQRLRAEDHPDAFRVLQGGLPYLLQPLSLEPSPEAGGEPPPQHAVVPLKIGDETLGILSVETGKTRRALEEGDIQCLKLAAHYAALSVFQARLLERERDLNQTLEARIQERTRLLEEEQDERVRSEQLAIVGKMTAAIAHELRNPLGVINNAAFLLSLKLKNPDEKIAQTLNTLRNQVRVSESVINRFLDISKEIQPRLRPARWLPTVQAALESLPQRPNVELQADVDPDLPPVPMDAELMARVVNNLVQNAMQICSATGNPGVVCVEAGDNERESWLSVSDNGPGVPEENRERIFEPFFTTRPNGIGLGLPLVKRIVEAHGGHLTVETAHGGGAQFVVHLPRP